MEVSVREFTEAILAPSRQPHHPTADGSVYPVLRSELMPRYARRRRRLPAWTERFPARAPLERGMEHAVSLRMPVLAQGVLLALFITVM